MSNVVKCPMCERRAMPTLQDFSSGKIDAQTKKEIVVKDIAIYSCTNSDCEHTWLPTTEEQKIDRIVASRSRFDLSKNNISLFRKALGFKTKTQASKFLCLNEKAFSKWELGYSEPNRAYDLLIRLATFSKENFNFIKKLHDNHFEFKPTEYELVSSYIHPISKPSHNRNFAVEGRETWDSIQLKNIGPDSSFFSDPSLQEDNQEGQSKLTGDQEWAMAA